MIDLKLRLLPWATAAMLAVGAVNAKLPPPSEEAKAQAAEATARTAWGNKVADYKLCLAMDRVAERYAAEARMANKDAPAPVLTPPCTDPGPFVYGETSPKPAAEAAGAHSPAETAKNPPSSNTGQTPPTPDKK